MKKLIIILSIFYHTRAMPQTFQFSQLGLNILSIHSSMKELKDLPILPASKLVNYNPLNFWFLNYNKYYFLNSSSMYLKDVGSIKELFIVPDEKENIKAIFIFIVKPCSNLKSLLNNTFDMPAVEANSGMLNQQRSQTLWNKNGISVFLTDVDNHKYTKISILLQGDENTPGVNIE